MMNAGAKAMSYERARRLVLVAGLVVLVATGGVMWLRGVDPVEIWGALLFIPVLIALVFWNLRGGLVAGALAAVAYAALRYPAIQAVGAGALFGLIASRALAYIAFGGLGGWAHSQLSGSLTKLELYDQIDDETGLYNARFFVQQTDLEMSRSRRYQTIFSVVMIRFPAASTQGLPRRERAAVCKDLGRMLKNAVRTVDHAVHGFDGQRHRVAVLLPETGPEGARTFVDRLGDGIEALLADRKIEVGEGGVERVAITFPDDGEDPIEELRGQFRAIDRLEHPAERRPVAG